MENLAQTLLIAIALIMIIEGLVYAFFPAQIQKIMSVAISMPSEKLRSYGGLILAAGAIYLWFLIH